jgi:4-hydroxy-tetrahydrodipicolinate reductase
MGQAIIRAAEQTEAACIVAGVDVNPEAQAACTFPIYRSITEFPGKADVIVDFSHHTALPSLADYACKTNTPMVIATTGHTEEEKSCMTEAASHIAVFASGNMSIGINLLIELCRKAAKTLGEGFDIEIVEKHHNQKLDAPSGTALMIANALSEERAETELVYDRHAVRQKRSPSEIGMHSVRGGTIVGVHEVLFAGANEMIELSHTATSREVFADGALKAAIYLAGKPAGLYSMTDLIQGA